MNQVIVSHKKCPSCTERKPSSEFCKCKKTKDGLYGWCRECKAAANKSYKKTKNGLTTRIYFNQESTSIKRGHDQPDYTLEELREWLFKQQNFIELYDKWVESGYNKKLTPSCDRLDDYKPYTFDNLRLVTWKENNKKGYTDKINGINNKASKAVIQMTQTGELITEYYSQMHASRVTGVSNGDISSCCSGRLKTAGGYCWMISLGMPIFNNQVGG